MKATITLKITRQFENEEIDCLRDNLAENHLRSLRAEHQLIDMVKSIIEPKNTEAQVDFIDDSVSLKWPGGFTPILEMTPAEQWEMGLKP